MPVPTVPAQTMPLTRYAQGIRLRIKAKPGVSRATMPRCVPLAGGETAIEIAVAAPPEDGRANKALIETIAKALGVSRSAVRVVGGKSGRLKLVEVEGKAPEALLARAEGWMRGMKVKGG